MSESPFTVDTDWLAARLDQPDVSIVDGSWYLPNMGRDGRAEFEAAHIPGAVFFDIDEMSEPGSSLPHTLASPEDFAEKVGALGISDEDTIVVYDGMGLFSAPRVWWNFRVMGATKVVLLDGGFRRWVEKRLPVEAGSPPIKPKRFKPSFESGQVVSFAEMHDIVDNRARQIIDARPFGRFTGDEPEPREAMRSGHMPGALSVPATTIATDGSLKSAGELRQIFQEAGVDLSRPVVTTCGSGVTAAALKLALETIGHRDTSLYDGSWSEWGGRPDTEIETGR